MTSVMVSTRAFRPSRLTCKLLMVTTRVVRANDTTKGQLTVDLIVKVEGEDKLLTSIFGVRTDSTEMRL